MVPGQLAGFLIELGLALLFTVFGIILWNGKGAWLISGYNVSSDAEKSKYDEKTLCRFVAKLMFFCAFCMVLSALAPLIGEWLIFVSTGIMLVGIIGGVIYANTGNRFKKK